MVWLSPALLASLLLAGGPQRSAAAEAFDPPEASRRLAEVLAGRQLIPPEGGQDGFRLRGPQTLREIYRGAAPAVPLVISPDGIGSAVVITVNAAEGSGWVITNHHVVKTPFRDKAGRPWVLLLFYDPQLASEPFDAEGVVRCANGRDTAGWCRVLLRAMRIGYVLGTDPDRDLALLHVPLFPVGVQPIPEAALDTIGPGDHVAVIGHPHGFLWSLTQGIVSGVRQRYPMGAAYGTVIQTQVPIAPGNSGGPLLSPEGRLLGVITWKVTGSEVSNMAVAINEVRSFAMELAARARGR